MAKAVPAKPSDATADAAAEKAYAAAASEVAKPNPAKPVAKAAKPAAKAPVEAPVAPKAEPAAEIAAPVIEPVAEIPPVVSAPVAAAAPKAVKVRKTPAPKAAAKAAPATKKVKAAKKAPVKKAPAMRAAKPAEAKLVVKRAATAVKAPRKTVTVTTQFKDKIMAKTGTTAEAITTKVKEAFAEAQERAKAAYEKSTAYVGEVNEFSKGNVEAFVESGKIFAAGMQELGKDYVAEGKSAIETMTADIKEFAAVKSPTDFFKLQGEIMRRNFDAAVASTSKHSEALVKLANEAIAPVSSRVSVAIEKVKQAA